MLGIWNILNVLRNLHIHRKRIPHYIIHVSVFVSCIVINRACYIINLAIQLPLIWWKLDLVLVPWPTSSFKDRIWWYSPSFVLLANGRYLIIVSTWRTSNTIWIGLKRSLMNFPTNMESETFIIHSDQLNNIIHSFKTFIIITSIKKIRKGGHLVFT